MLRFRVHRRSNKQIDGHIRAERREAAWYDAALAKFQSSKRRFEPDDGQAQKTVVRSYERPASW
jgi:hypothetical protein